MLERVAVFVDAGYFWVQLSYILYNDKKPRESIKLNAELMRESLLREVKREFPDHSLLRVYWYDSLGSSGEPSSQHKDICHLNDIKMRYGTRNRAGQQKGVDGLLIADLINLAQNGAIGSALILSGDADLTPGVSAAQMFGVRVHRLEISGHNASSPVLSEEVDRNYIWPLAEIQNFVHRAQADDASIPIPGTEETTDRTPASVPDAGAALSDDARTTAGDAPLPSLDTLARSFVESLSNEEKQLMHGGISIPQQIDKKLLFRARTGLGRFLGKEELKALRAAVKALVQ